MLIFSGPSPTPTSCQLIKSKKGKRLSLTYRAIGVPNEHIRPNSFTVRPVLENLLRGPQPFTRCVLLRHWKGSPALQLRPRVVRSLVFGVQDVGSHSRETHTPSEGLSKAESAVPPFSSVPQGVGRGEPGSAGGLSTPETPMKKGKRPFQVIFSRPASL